MNRLLIIGVIVLAASCANFPDKPAGKDKEPHEAGPMTAYLGEADLEDLLSTSDNFVEFRKQFLGSSGLQASDLTGQARLLFDGLQSIFDQSRLETLPVDPPKGTDQRCLDAYVAKRQWHLDNNNKIPANFGKIVEYSLTPSPKSDHWTGYMELCTWIGSDNYYFKIRFVEAGRNSLRLFEPDFSGTLDSIPPGLAAVIVESDFNYKLHGKKGATVYDEVHRNSDLIPVRDTLYAELEADCFDTFYRDEPDGTMANDLADQVGYCMGRCDGRVLNTGR